MTWQEFVVAYGRQARLPELAAVLGQPAAAIARLRATGVCSPGTRRHFGELFTLWHGRPPRDDEWPRPIKLGRGGGHYEWQAPERALLASLTGRVGPTEIAKILTARLRQITGDPAAARTEQVLNAQRQRIGLTTKDVVGGLSVSQAARQIGVSSILYTDIARGRLKAVKVGQQLVIPHAEFARWKAQRVFPPKGFVPLAPLKRPLGIHSDKLSEWARAGYVPTAVRCNPYGTRTRSTQFGSWWIDPKVAKKLVADRRAGRPMPWWGKPEPGNLQVTWRRWRKRKHPARCATCRDIWGPEGAPATFEDYSTRYPPLLHGAKRHLTRRWSPGLSIAELAAKARVSATLVQLAIENGVLRSARIGRRHFIARTDATRWIWRRCTGGTHVKSWLAIETACTRYLFTPEELARLIRERRLKTRLGTLGAERGIHYVLKAQVSALREEFGFTESETARRVGVSIARLRVLLRGLEWRPAPRIPLQVVQNCIKRQQSAEGVTVREAARILGKSGAWIEREIANGTARVLRTKWNKHRRYISFPMFKRLCDAALHPITRERWSADWLLVSDAAVLAGVSTGQMQKWADRGEVAVRLKSDYFRRYHRRSVMARARRYWASEVRFKRAEPPAWLVAERAQREEAA